MALEREMQTYRSKLPELLAHEGQFVLIHGETISGLFPTLDEALEAGHDRFELEPFLVKEIVEFEIPKRVSWRVGSCRC